MDFYCLHNKNMPWGDYGVTLLEGFTHQVDDRTVAIERSGPFAPPIVISSGHLIVTDVVKREIGLLKLRGVKFRPCLKDKIVHIPWTQWDRRDEPASYPAGGEPENYILRRKHNETIAGQMPKLWELCVPAEGATVGRKTRGKRTTLVLYENTWTKAEIFRAEPHCDHIFCTDNAREALKKIVGRSLRFEKFKSKVGTDEELQAEKDLHVPWWEETPADKAVSQEQREEFQAFVKKANQKVKDALKAKTDQGRSSRYASAYGCYQTAAKILPLEGADAVNLHVVLKYFNYE